MCNIFRDQGLLLHDYRSDLGETAQSAMLGEFLQRHNASTATPLGYRRRHAIRDEL